jgi:hypothetical protein
MKEGKTKGTIRKCKQRGKCKQGGQPVFGLGDPFPVGDILQKENLR